jgi:hypothetical protein
MREVMQTPGGRRDFDALQHLLGKAPQHPDGLALVHGKGFHELVANGENRIERGLWVLQNHGDVPTSYLPHLPGRFVQQIVASPLTMRAAGCGTNCTSDKAVIDLPQPDSPTRPNVSPRRRENVTPSTAFKVLRRLKK